jgi:hypothetical protein
MENPFEILENRLERIEGLLLEIINRNEPKEPEDVIITSIKELAETLNCSVVTAQKIKNRLPRGSYFQSDRKFVLSRNYLLKTFPRLKIIRTYE